MVNHSTPTTHEVLKSIQSPEYLAFFNFLMESTGKRPCEDVYQAEAEFLRDCINAADIDYKDVLALATGDDYKFRKFCVELIDAEPHWETGQEYNPNAPRPDDEPENEAYVGHSLTTVFQYSIFYLMLRDHRGRLIKFFKDIGQPHPSKFASNISNFYDQLN